VWWTGLIKTEVKKCLETIENELLSVEIDGFERDYVMVKTDYEQLARFKTSRTRSLALLPYEDPYPKGYKVRDRLVDAEHEKKAFVGGGVLPTVLLDGKIVGTWSRDLQQLKGPVQLRFFTQPERGLKENVVRKVKAATRLMTGRNVDVNVTVES